ncbi:MAG: inorganic phosphate transporter, partial [Candidatus Omnitrophica bacterium]|nr:inorganic phosphate transporter [Candidatus Omnitrophota bacterium]
AIVCSVVGIGAFYHSLAVKKFAAIIAWWLITPLLAMGLSYIFGKFLYFRILHVLSKIKYEDKIKRLLGILITVSGCYVAFSAGSNNAANAVGPLVGAGVLNIWQGAILAGIGMSTGALLMGGHVLETVGKKITDIGIVRAILVEATCATIILFASLMGIPVSLGETVTSGIIGLSCANSGFTATVKNEHVIRIWIFWAVGPFFSFGLTFLLLTLGRWILPHTFSYVP